MEFKKAKRTTPPQKISADDLDEIGGTFLNYIEHLSEEEIFERAKKINFSYNDLENNLSDIKDTLRSEGIVIMENFYDSCAMEIASRGINLLQENLKNAEDKPYYENTDIIIQNGTSKYRNYAELASCDKPVADIRQGSDSGMIDVFNFDFLAGSSRETLRSPFIHASLINIIEDYSSSSQAQNLNLYLNRSIVHTRGFHADSYKPTLKGFVYLSDVTSLSDGPYCYVRQSNHANVWRTVNKKVSELTNVATEAPFVDLQNVTPVLGKRGTFVLSDQSGIHRGIPQKNGRERKVIVMRYK
ncbi:MAG: hypothetical protein ABJN26_22515 [Stappiaceae bacterium]